MIGNCSEHCAQICCELPFASPHRVALGCVRLQSEGNQAVFDQQSFHQDMRASMETMQNTMHSQMEAQMEAMRARMEESMHAKFQQQLEAEISKNLETHVTSPLKDLHAREEEKAKEKAHEMETLKLEHEMTVLKQKLEAEKEVAVVELQAQLKALQTESQAALATQETLAVETMGNIRQELQASKQQASEFEAVCVPVPLN